MSRRQTAVTGNRSSQSLLTLKFCLQSMAIKYQYLKRRLWLFGVDPLGLSVAVGINDFKPSVLIKGEAVMDDVESWRLSFNLELFEANPAPTCKYSLDNEDDGVETPEYVCDIQVEWRTPLIGFTNGRKDRMLRLICKDVDSHTLVIERLQMKSVQLFHEDWALLNQFLHITKFQYQDWIEINLEDCFNPKSTLCNTETVTSITRPVKITEKLATVAPVLKCFIRVVVVSQTALMERKFQMRPDPAKPFDRVLAAMLAM